MLPIDDSAESAWGPVLVRGFGLASSAHDTAVLSSLIATLAERARTPLLRRVAAALRDDLACAAELAPDRAGLSVASGPTPRTLQARPPETGPAARRSRSDRAPRRSVQPRQRS